MSNLIMYVGTANKLSATLVDDNGIPITDADVVSYLIETVDDVPVLVDSGLMTHTTGGVYEVTLAPDVFDLYEDVQLVTKITAEEPAGTQIAYMECNFIPRVNECQGSAADGGLGNVGTMCQRVLEEVDRERSLDDHVCMRAIISTIEELRWKPFFFNKGWFNFTLIDGVYRYGPSSIGAGWPSDLLWITNMQIQNPVGGNLWWDVEPVSQSNIQEWLNVRYSRTTPRFFKWFNETIVFGPIPNREYQIECDMVRDIGTPKMNFKDQKWYFYDPHDSSKLIDPDYTNAWFTWGERLVRAGAVRRIMTEVLRSEEGAKFAISTEKTEFHNLTAATEHRQVPRTRRKSWGL